MKKGWKVIKTRWIDINKGDREHPNYRSRLVAKEFRRGANPEWFAATPPLEALKFLISDAACMKRGERRKKIMIRISQKI